MCEALVIWQASPAEIDEMVSVDDDASVLFAQAGLHADLGPEHPFSVAERACWTRCARQGTGFMAGESPAHAVGLLVMDRIDRAPYLEQLSVRRIAMRQGLGGRLLERAIAWAGHEPLWLTTYAHIPWNGPFYERHGFVTVPQSVCPPGIVRILEDQRRALPAPDQRIAMRRIGG